MEAFDRECNPITTEEWVQLLSQPGYKRIALTELHTGEEISTVWLGMSHGYGPNGPFIFETMIFNENGEGGECYRYATEEEARKGHANQVDIHTHGEAPPTRWWSISEELE